MFPPKFKNKFLVIVINEILKPLIFKTIFDGFLKFLKYLVFH